MPVKPFKYLAAFLAFLSISLSPASYSDSHTTSVTRQIGDVVTVLTDNMHLTADELETLLTENPETILLDIRSRNDFENGHLANAVHIDYFSQDFKQSLNTLDKDASYVVYCRSGARSERAVELLKEVGIEQSNILGGGFRAWRAADKEIVDFEG